MLNRIIKTLRVYLFIHLEEVANFSPKRSSMKLLLNEQIQKKNGDNNVNTNSNQIITSSIDNNNHNRY